MLSSVATQTLQLCWLATIGIVHLLFKKKRTKENSTFPKPLASKHRGLTVKSGKKRFVNCTGVIRPPYKEGKFGYNIYERIIEYDMLNLNE